MGTAAWLTSAIATADAATQALGIREDVTHEAHVQSDAFGTPTELTAPVLRPALVQRKQGLLKTANGLEIKYEAIVSFVGPVVVDARDKITLADGVTGPLYIPAGGLTDPATGQPFLRVVYIRK